MRPNQALIAANGVAVPQVYASLLRKNIRKSSAKPNDFVGRNRKLATNSFYVMGEIFLETLMVNTRESGLAAMCRRSKNPWGWRYSFRWRRRSSARDPHIVAPSNLATV
jgi:hypothetical protein